MRNGEVIHPGADFDLLARWHDRELAPGEKAHFETHRAHCAACRRAAEDYTAALSFFRSSRSSRPPRDLSARILSRIQPAGSRRPPVGIVHGIDLRWAAALVLAIIAGLLGRTGAPDLNEAAMPIRLVTPAVEAVAAAPAPAPEPPSAAAPVAESESSARPRPARIPEARPVYPLPDAIAASRLPAPAPRRLRAAPPAPTPATPVANASVRRSAERYGGDGAGGDVAGLVEPVRPVEPLEVRITSADAAGWPPGVRNAEEIRLPVEQRGLRYIVMVDAQGVVRAVETVVPSGARGGRVLGVVPPSEIWKIKFEADGRPRRLLLKID
jgi:hypothetical protein